MDAEESSEESEEGGVEPYSRSLPSAEEQKVVQKEQAKQESQELQSQGEENWTFVGKTGHYSVSARNDNSVIRPSGPKFFPIKLVRIKQRG